MKQFEFDPDELFCEFTDDGFWFFIPFRDVWKSVREYFKVKKECDN